MTIEEAVNAYLSAHPMLTGLVGVNFYPLLVPKTLAEPSKAAIAYQRISGSSILAHNGATGLRRARLQFTVTGPSYQQVKQVAETLVTLLDGFHGNMGGKTIAEISLDNDIDGIEFETDRKTVRQDYQILYKE